jgi:hypothetical protein
MTWSDIWKWLRDVLAVGGPSVVLAYGLFKWLGEKWIEQRFGIRLEKFKSDQQKELEKLRHLLSSRVSRIHEKEFEVLPRAWFLLHDAHGKACHCISRLRQYPDFARLPEPKFEEFLKNSRLSDSQREELRQAPNRLKSYSETLFWIELNDAESAQVAFHNYLVENSIFMTDDLRARFGAVDKDLSDALIEHRNWKQYAQPDLFQASSDKITGLSEKINLVEQAVQKRLHYEEA